MSDNWTYRRTAPPPLEGDIDGFSAFTTGSATGRESNCSISACKEAIARFSASPVIPSVWVPTSAVSVFLATAPASPVFSSLLLEFRSDSRSFFLCSTLFLFSCAANMHISCSTCLTFLRLYRMPSDRSLFSELHRIPSGRSLGFLPIGVLAYYPLLSILLTYPI